MMIPLSNLSHIPPDIEAPIAKMIQQSRDSRSFRDYPPPVAYVYRRSQRVGTVLPIRAMDHTALFSSLASEGEFVVLSWRKTWSLSEFGHLIAPIQCGLKALPPTIDRSYAT